MKLHNLYVNRAYKLKTGQLASMRYTIPYFDTIEMHEKLFDWFWPLRCHHIARPIRETEAGSDLKMVLLLTDESLVYL